MRVEQLILKTCVRAVLAGLWGREHGHAFVRRLRAGFTLTLAVATGNCLTPMQLVNLMLEPCCFFRLWQWINTWPCSN